jgi:hypothetical protein
MLSIPRLSIKDFELEEAYPLFDCWPWEQLAQSFIDKTLLMEAPQENHHAQASVMQSNIIEYQDLEYYERGFIDSMFSPLESNTGASSTTESLNNRVICVT